MSGLEPAPPEAPAERLVYGLQPVRECVRVHGSRLARLALTAGPSPRLAALERFARDSGVARVERLARPAMDRLAKGGQHQGAIATAPPLRLHSWEDLVERPGLLAVALDRIQDPQNFGAVVRSAVATSGAVVLWGEHSSAPLTPATFRASAGAIEHATLCRVPSLADALRAAAAQGVQVVGLAARAERGLHEVDLTARVVVVVGSEGGGLSAGVRRSCTREASLVQSRIVDSLNASAAAAIALYEAARQRLISSA